MHVLAQITTDMVHFPGEDSLLAALLLEHNGSTRIQTKQVMLLSACRPAVYSASMHYFSLVSWKKNAETCKNTIFSVT